MLREKPEGEVNAEDVFEAARKGDPFAEDIIARLGARLARIAVVLSSLLDIERVVIAGGISRAIEPVLEIVELRASAFDLNLDVPQAPAAWICLSRQCAVPAQPSTIQA